MLFNFYAEDLLSGIGHVGHDVVQINKLTQSVQSRLTDLFASAKDRFGAVVTTPEGSYLQVQSHYFGTIDAHLSYANEGSGTFGRVVIRKRLLDESGKESWPEIYAFRILKDGDILASDYGPVLYNSYHTPDERKHIALRPLLEAIVLSAMKPR